MNRANFFILGAPKCGTTSMDVWLSEHPQIFMATKEPHYFNTDHQNRTITTLNDYQQLFKNATKTQLAIGETSVRYLYSDTAVQNILAYNPDAKFIVMLRNPLNMAYSWHSQLCFSAMEDVQDFTRAWQLQDKRLASEQIPPKCREAKMLYYGKICCLGEQLQRLYTQVDSKRVHLIFFDDLTKNPQSAYQSILHFLGVAGDNRQDFPILNAAKTRILPFLTFQYGGYQWLKRLKSKLGIQKKLGLLNYINRLNTKAQKRPSLPLQTQQDMHNYFKDDIALLSTITQRDLTHWITDVR